PPSGGVSVLRGSIAICEDQLRHVEALLDALAFEGIAMAGVKNDGRTAWVVELNARLWGSLQLALAAGIDFPRLLVEASLGLPSQPRSSYQLGLRSRWLLGDLDHAWALFRGEPGADGRKGIGAALRVVLGPAGPQCRWEILRRDDLGP